MKLDAEASIVEAILFLENDAVDVPSLVRISKLSRTAVEEALSTLQRHFEESEFHGLELAQIGDAYVFRPKPRYWETLRERYGKKNEARLSRAAMETLSIIAYSQPITRAEIEGIRGVGADSMIRQLLAKELIREVGRKDSPGRPVQYGTSRKFLETFRLSSIKDLPKLDELERDRFELGE